MFFFKRNQTHANVGKPKRLQATKKADMEECRSVRRQTSRRQKKRKEKEFEKSHYPDLKTREELSERTTLSEARIQVRTIALFKAFFLDQHTVPRIIDPSFASSSYYHNGGGKLQSLGNL